MNWFSVSIAALAGLAVSLLIFVGATTVTAVRAVPWRQWCERMMRWAVRERYAKQLCYANLAHWHVADFWVLRMVSGFCVGVTVLMFGFGLFWTIVGLVLGWILVGVWLGQRVKEQQRLLATQLPAFLDLLSMSLSAGMNLQTAVQLVLAFQAKTALANLWRTWLLQVRSGTARIQAFKQMLDRVQSPALRRICVALIQAEQSGSGMASSLQAHSQQLRQERMMNAEKQALKAPVKMLLPLVVCFFPSTFLVLGFSIYINMGDLL